MGRVLQPLISGSFASGRTSVTVKERGAQLEILSITDAVISPTGILRPRPEFITKATPNQPIEYLNAIPQPDGGWIVAAATPTQLLIYAVDALQFSLKTSIPRSTDLPVHVVGYQGDLFFTIDGYAYTYDVTANAYFPLSLPTPPPPTATVTSTPAPLQGTYLYRITYIRQTSRRFRDEGPASEPVSVQTRGTAVTLSLPTPPTGAGISHIGIYRAIMDGAIVRPYLEVAIVPAGTTSFTDTKSLADLGSALYTLGVSVPRGTAITVFLDHLFLADGDRVFISAPYRPCTFPPGFDLAMDEAQVFSGDIRNLIRMRDGVLVVKRESLYRIIPSGSERTPFLRGLLSDAIGVDSPYGSTPIPGGDVLMATPTLLTTLSSGGRENVLGPLIDEYRQIPEAARSQAYLYYAPSQRWTFVILGGQNFINTEGAWVSWTLPISAVCSLPREGEDVILIGTSDGRIGILEGVSQSAATISAIFRAVPGLDLIVRGIAFHAQGLGSIHCRVSGNTASGMQKSFTVNADKPQSLFAPTFARGHTLRLDVIASGRIELLDYTIYGRTGRTR